MGRVTQYDADPIRLTATFRHRRSLVETSCNVCPLATARQGVLLGLGVRTMLAESATSNQPGQLSLPELRIWLQVFLCQMHKPAVLSLRAQPNHQSRPHPVTTARAQLLT